MADKKTIKKTVIKTAPKAVSKPAVKPVKASYLEVPLYDLVSKEPKTISLPKGVFAVEAKPALLAQYVRVYQTNLRQGNASTKTRSEVIGTTQKVYKQKGTGRARHGSKKAPIFVGGGVTFGPQPHDFSLKINKKQKRRAFLGALTLKAKDHAVAVMSNNFLKMEPKTKLMVSFLKNAGYGHESLLLIFPKMEKNGLIFASRNLPNMKLSSFENLNAYEILKYKKLLFIEDSLTKLESLVAKKS